MTDHEKSDPALFLQVVAMFQMAAMQQMGKLVDPVSNEVVRNLDQARTSIDIIEMLERKCAGNLEDVEKTFLEKVLFELRMNYVDEARAQGSADPAAPSDPDAQTEGED